LWDKAMGSIGVSDYSYESEKAAPSQVLLLTCGDVALNRGRRIGNDARYSMANP